MLRDLQKDLGLFFSDHSYYPKPDWSVWIWTGNRYKCDLGVIWPDVVKHLETVKNIPQDPFDKRDIPYLVCDFGGGWHIFELATFLEAPQRKIFKDSFVNRFPYFIRVVTKKRKVGDIAYPLIMIYGKNKLITSQLFGISWFIRTDIYDWTWYYLPPLVIGGGVKLGGEEYRLLKNIDSLEGNLVDVNNLSVSELIQLTPEMIQ